MSLRAWYALRLGILTIGLIVDVTTRFTFAQSGDGGGTAALREYLESRVAANSGDVSSWRLLGRACAQAGDTARAGEALERALAIDPLNVAAHFDLGELLLAEQRQTLGAKHLREVTRLAPDSDYARDARERLAYLPPAATPEATLASYEIKQFDGADRIDPERAADAPLQPSRPFSLRIEAGGLYNTNVALTPTSREFFTEQAASFQGFLNPDLEYRVVDADNWRAGPRFTGYFNLNEAAWSNLNLQSYQGALFVEKSVPWEGRVLVPRLQYAYTHDAFQGTTFADRHALVASAASYWDDGDLTLAYLSGDYTNFASDGGDPPVSSRDGYSAVGGASHTRLIGHPQLRTITYGGDLQFTDTIGSNFAFAGVSLYGEAELPLIPTWTLLVDGGWGYRDYFRSDLAPSRNEHLWRGGARLRKTINEHWSVVGVVNYNRFDSANAFFQADRLIGGIVTVFE